jgi:hypothetical protein
MLPSVSQLPYINHGYTLLAFRGDPGPSEELNIIDAIRGECAVPQPLAQIFYALKLHFDTDASRIMFAKYFRVIKPGANLSDIADHFVYWVLTDDRGPRVNSVESDRQRFDRMAKIYARRLAGEEPSEEEWEDIYFVAPFGIWQAEREQRTGKFATLAYYSAAAPHSDFALKCVIHNAIDCVSPAYPLRMADKLLSLIEAAQ